MLTLPDNLTDADLVLLYLSDELPPDDRDAFAIRLAAEPDLRRRVDAMRGVQDAVFAALDEADAFSAVPSSWAAAHAVGRAVKGSDAMPATRRRRMPRWVGIWMLYPSAAAAVVAVGLWAWWANVQEDPKPSAYDGRQLLTVADGASRDPASMSDDQIEAQFDPIVVDYDSRLRRSLRNLDYLEQTLP